MLGIAAAVVVLGVIPALQRRSALASDASARVALHPRVVFVEAAMAPASTRVTLPARIEARQQTSLFSQVSGYLGPMLADVGDHVSKGQLLVEIRTPIVDRQLEQNASSREVAVARVDQAAARLALATASLARLRSVSDARAISQQAIDEAAANERSDSATLAAARAELAAVEADGRRLAEIKQLARIVAPFDGEVTLRSHDEGTLIVADRADTARPIFAVTDRGEVRAFVDVPQSLASSIEIGQPLTITVRELPGRAFSAAVLRMAPTLSDPTRTRLVEARLSNADHALLPGMFVEASLEVRRESSTAFVPGEALLVREGRAMVAVVDPDDTLRYAPVEVGRDSGTLVEILDGIRPGERVAINFSLQFAPGTHVEPVPRPK